MKPIKFKYQQQFTTGNGSIITMKALVTIHGMQYIECLENDKRYKPEELTLIKEYNDDNQ